MTQMTTTNSITPTSNWDLKYNLKCCNYKHVYLLQYLKYMQQTSSVTRQYERTAELNDDLLREKIIDS